ncbi:MAG TPA: demethoxyubiquinone hydroxylase family protein, partial [Candidatus Dormibacteraeota bacterium]|nr:demethoxyubiquinone hydroxylase family protein [Candidatus Dormibacteraeota bacterium]
MAAPSQRFSSLSASDLKSLRANWAAETRMAGVYEALAVVTSNPRARQRLKALAETEIHHAQAWAELLSSCGVRLSDRRPYLTARMLALLARVAGIGPALALAGLAEGQVLRSYLSQVSTVSNEQAQGVLRRVLPEELDHQSPDDVAQRSEDGAPSPVVMDEEWHAGGAESIRNVIYGVNDGLTATLGVLSGVGGASADPRVVLIGGLSAMVASGVSMAGGAYLASKSQREVFEGQLAREAAEIEAMPELERAELVDIYRSKGLTADEAKTIVNRITQDKKVWLETQAREELGLDVSQFENPVREGVVAGISTLIGGAIPVVGYLVGRWLVGARFSGFGSLAIAF